MNEYIINISIKHTKTTLDHLSEEEITELLIDLHLQICQLNDYVEARLERVDQ